MSVDKGGLMLDRGKKRVCLFLTVMFMLLASAVSANEMVENFEDGEWANQEMESALSCDSQKEINGWTLSKTDVSNSAEIKLREDPYRFGEKSIYIGRPNSWQGGAVTMKKSFDPVSDGVEVSFRFTTPQTFGGSGHYFSLQSSDSKNVLYFGCGTTDGDDYNGKDWNGDDLSLGTWTYSFGMFFRDVAPTAISNTSYVDKQPVVDGRLAYVGIDNIAYKYFIWEERFVKFAIDCNAKQIDVYYDIEPITDQEPVTTIPFIDMSAEDIGQITFGSVSGGRLGMYYDDITVSDSGIVPPKPVTPYVISDAEFTPVEDSVSVSANIKKGSKTSGTAFAAAYDENGCFIGMSVPRTITADSVFNETFSINGDISSVKVMVWSDFQAIQPYAASVSAQRKDPPPPPGPSILNETFDSGQWAQQSVDTDLSTPMIFGENHETSHQRGEDTVIDGWTLQGQDYTASTFRLANDPLGGANKMLRVKMSSNPDWHDSGLKATKEFDKITDTAVFSCRFTTGSTSNGGRNHFLQLYDGNKVLFTLGGDYCGTNRDTIDWAGREQKLNQWNNYMGIHFDSYFPSVEKSVDKYEEIDGKYPYIKLGGRSANQTNYMKLVMHFDTKLIDVYYSSQPIDDETALTVTVPFMDTTATGVDKIMLGGGNYARDDMYWDDISLYALGD